MNAKNLAQLVDKTDLYRPLDQISEELGLDYDQIMEGLEELSNKEIVLNLDYLNDMKPYLHLTEEQFCKFQNSYAKSKLNKRQRPSNDGAMSLLRSELAISLEDAVCKASCKGMGLAEMEKTYDISRKQIYCFLGMGIGDGKDIQVDHLIAELENEIELLKNFRNIAEFRQTNDLWNLNIEWIDNRGEFHKYMFCNNFRALCDMLDISYQPEISAEDLKAEIFLKLRSEKCKKVQHIGIEPANAINETK